MYIKYLKKKHINHIFFFDFSHCYSFPGLSHHQTTPTHEPPGCWQLCLPTKVPPATTRPHRRAGPPCPGRPPKRFHERRWQNAPSMRGAKMETNCRKCRAAGGFSEMAWICSWWKQFVVLASSCRKHNVKESNMELSCPAPRKIALNGHSPSLALRC